MAEIIVRAEADADALAVASFEKDMVTAHAIPIDDDTDNPDGHDGLGETDPGRRIIKIKVFDPHKEPKDKVFPVSILDCIMPRMLVPVTCTYQLAEGADKEAILSNVCDGLRRLLGEYEFLAGDLHEPEDGGRAFVRRTAAHATFEVRVQDVTVSDPDFPSFRKLKEQHFPPSHLDHMIPAQDLVAQDGKGVPAMVVQLNLIHGGLVMGIAVHHLLVDARALDLLLARWAAHSRSALDPTRHPPLSPPAPRDLDRAALARPASGATGACAPDYRRQAVASLVYSPGGLPAPKISLEAMDRHIWHIPASKLAALKASAAPDPAAAPAAGAAQRWVSTNDCITALMWRAVTRSRLAAHGVVSAGRDDARPVALENSLDVRGAFPGPRGVPRAYAGNVVMFSRAEMPLCELVAPGALRAVAVRAREAVEEYRSWPTVRRAMEWIAACPRGADVEMDIGAIGGLDFVTTSWRVLEAYERADFGFGPLMGLRWAASVIDGYCFLFPTRPSGIEDEGVEIYLGLEKGCMERLLLDEELARWAEVRN